MTSTSVLLKYFQIAKYWNDLKKSNTRVTWSILSIKEPINAWFQSKADLSGSAIGTTAAARTLPDIEARLATPREFSQLRKEISDRCKNPFPKKLTAYLFSRTGNQVTGDDNFGRSGASLMKTYRPVNSNPSLINCKHLQLVKSDNVDKITRQVIGYYVLSAHYLLA